MRAPSGHGGAFFFPFIPLHPASLEDRRQQAGRLEKHLSEVSR